MYNNAWLWSSIQYLQNCAGVLVGPHAWEPHTAPGWLELPSLGLQHSDGIWGFSYCISLLDDSISPCVVSMSSWLECRIEGKTLLFLLFFCNGIGWLCCRSCTQTLLQYRTQASTMYLCFQSQSQIYSTQQWPQSPAGLPTYVTSSCVRTVFVIYISITAFQLVIN